MVMLHTSDTGNRIMSAVVQDFQKRHPFLLPLSLSAVMIVLYLIPLVAMTVRGKGSGPGIWGLFSIIAILITIAAPIVYGWQTRDAKGAVFIGVFPFLITMTVPRIVSGELPRDTTQLVRTVIYIASLCTISGLEGYFASRHEDKSLLAALALAGLWFIVFLSGLN